MVVESHEAVDKISAHTDRRRAVHLRQRILTCQMPAGVRWLLGRPCYSGTSDAVDVFRNWELLLLLLLIYNVQLQPFYDPLSGTTRVSRYQKDKPFWIFLK